MRRSAPIKLLAYLRVPRKVLAVLVLGVYLIAGALHGFCDFDVTRPSGNVVISLADKSTGQSENGALAGHHCHGCFSVSVPAPVTASFDLAPAREAFLGRVVPQRWRAPGIDPRPPKILT